jgi:hypothetical protein
MPRKTPLNNQYTVLKDKELEGKRGLVYGWLPVGW